MEKQIQTLTLELDHLKNNYNKVINSETENHSQQQSQAKMLQRILERNEITSPLTPKNRMNASVQNRGVTKRT